MNAQTDDPLARLRDCLSDRYDVVREIGRGGMGAVFLATDKRHDRRVAIKVMLPDLAAAVGAGRFLREIAVAAHLEHPYILSLYDSGEAAGLPYYVMRYVEGESLRDRLMRDKQLSLEETVELTRQVALALDYAHSRGIVHRDIKPQNILVSDGGPLVADFGLALALAATGTEKLTGTGIAVGSPEYMSPEQAAGGRIDHRSDIYSLGCVVYELLVGEPPFTGRTPHMVVARHSAEPVPDLRLVRTTIPPEMERAVKKALAKVPADRFRTASEFAEALRASLAPVPVSLQPSRKRRRLPQRPIIGVALVGLLLSAAIVVGRLRDSESAPPFPGESVAVLPFRFSGVVDSSVLTPTATAELISTRLTGAGELRPIDPAVVLRHWQTRGQSPQDVSEREALQAAAASGATLALLGTVHATPSSFVLGGSLHAVSDGHMLYRVAGISGPPDSVANLLDRLVISLLVQRAGEGWRRLDDLTTSSLEAVKAYVAGLESYRRGRYVAATQAFDHALQVEPGFTLARMRLAIAHQTAGNTESGLRALDEAWAERGRLARNDSLFLTALVGQRHPALTSLAASLRNWEWIADSLPQYWEGTYQLGEMLFAWGPMLAKEQSRERARAAFQQVLEVDSAFAPAVERLIDLAALAQDTAQVKRLGRRFFMANPDADNTDYVRWRLAVALGDSATRRQIRGRFGLMTRTELEQIVGMSQLAGYAIEDAAAAVSELQRQSRNEYDVWWVNLLARGLALNRGRPGDAPEEIGDVGFALPLDELYRIIEAVYWNGEREAAERLVALQVAEADAPSPRNAAAGGPRDMRICAASLWRLSRGEVGRVATWLVRLRAATRGADQRSSTMYLPICAATVQARLAVLTGQPDADRSLASLDSLMRSGPITNPYIALAGRITVADLQERRGNLGLALAAVRQRPFQPFFGVTGLSELLLREGRLAARTGDRAGAIRSFEHFLRLRTDAEPRFQAENERVRSELAALKQGAVRAQPQAR